MVAPWFFRLPGCAATTATRSCARSCSAARDASDDLVTHELCHVWQIQHRPVHVVLTYLTTRYRRNPYELEAGARSS